ncbi:hypothetical protein [Mucilaginibacter sp. SG564]|uniref:hypothetical protein n=1 Tax=unclassified Mucilaginibacter TaxID=2617802 RepID=UPI001556AEA3|nr:hypothetical protein [Mucilaginibacter sp. SG564]NOW94612.1 hypothetical protein [Mucilaginibacter sp. SG564]
MILSLPIYRLIKNLRSYFNRTSNTCEVIDDEIIIVNSGSLRGLILEFHYNFCQVKICGRFSLCIDITRDISVDVLMRILMSHNIISSPPAP